MLKEDAMSGHEVMHMASVMADMFERHLLDHRFVQQNPVLKEQAEAIGDMLGAFYQQVGRAVFDEQVHQLQEKAPRR